MFWTVRHFSTAGSARLIPVRIIPPLRLSGLHGFSPWHGLNMGSSRKQNGISFGFASNFRGIWRKSAEQA
jgi:hypothetical protein